MFGTLSMFEMFLKALLNTEITVLYTPTRKIPYPFIYLGPEKGAPCFGRSFPENSTTVGQLFIFRATFFLSSNFLYSQQILDRIFPKIVRVLFEAIPGIRTCLSILSCFSKDQSTKFVEDFRGSSEDVSTIGPFVKYSNMTS